VVSEEKIKMWNVCQWKWRETTDCHNVTEILLNVALNTITLTYYEKNIEFESEKQKL
jgi:hypothetical protein